MVRSPIDQLKADAFVLSKLLAERKVKLSSQQCLDVLARLRENKPYEALASHGQADPTGRRVEEKDGSQPTLFEWMMCGVELTSLLQALSRSEIRKASMLTMGSVEGVLTCDTRSYMRASAVASEMFSRTAEAFVRPQLEAPWCRGLDFKVEPLDPVFEGGIGKIIITPIEGRRSTTSRGSFNGLRLDKQRDPWVHERPLAAEIAFMLYPTAAAYAEADHDVCDEQGEGESGELGLELEPGVRASFSVVGESMVGGVAAALADGTMQQVWREHGSFEVLLSGDKSLDEDNVRAFGTETDANGEKLASWCDFVVTGRQGRDAKELRKKQELRLSLVKVLEPSDSQRELERVLVALCRLLKALSASMQSNPS